MVPPNFSIFPYWVLGLDVPLRIWVQIKPCTAQWRAMTGKQASDFSGLFRSVHSIPQIIASQGLILSTLPAQLKDFKSMPYIAQLPSHGKLLLATVAQIYQARRINKPGFRRTACRALKSPLYVGMRCPSPSHPRSTSVIGEIFGHNRSRP